MIPHVTNFMPLHPPSSDSLHFLLSSFQHNVSAGVSPRSPRPLIPLPNSLSSPPPLIPLPHSLSYSPSLIPLPLSLSSILILLPPISTFSSLILFCPHHTLPSFFPSHSSSSGGPCTCRPAFLCSFIVPGSETQLPPLFLHAWCILLTSMPFPQLSFITPVLSVLESTLVIWVLSGTWGVIIQSEISSWSFPFKHLLWEPQEGCHCGSHSGLPLWFSYKMEVQWQPITLSLSCHPLG